MDFDIRYAHTKDGRIAFGVAGDGPVLITPPSTLISSNFSRGLWFGGLGDGDVLRPGHTVVVYDHLGSGLSDRARYDFTLDGLVGEFEAVVAALGADDIGIVANGAAGPVAVRYAVEHPDQVRALCLDRTWSRGADYVRSDRFAGYLDGLRGGDWTLASQMFLRLVGNLSGPEAEEWAAVLRETCAQEDYLTYIDAISEHDVTELLPLVSAATLVTADENALFIDVSIQSGVAADIPGARLHIFSEASERSEHIAAFLTDLETHHADGQGSLGGGFQTILFTDLEASTPLTQRLGDEGAQEILRGHNTAVRGALDEHGGREVKHTGDGIMASFPSAVSAVTAALQIQRGLAGGEVRVRIGLNAGEPIAEDDDLFGLSVIKAARIADRAEPGQVLVSNVVMELCEGKTFEFAPLGAVSLKGFDEAVTLFEVSA